MRRDHVVLHSLATGPSNLIAYGHYGRPVLVFPSDNGRAGDFEDRGVVGAIGGLIDDGRVKLYAIDSYDGASWRNAGLSLEDRAREHRKFEDFVLNDVVPFIEKDCAGASEILVTGCSFGAYHAANFALKHAHRFPFAICMSGVYDMSRIGWGERGDSFYFNNPMDYVANLSGEHLDWLRSQVRLELVCGQGAWEDETTGALESTRRFSALLSAKGIAHELDLWGDDVPHDWPSWRAQLAHHLPRFC